MSASTTTAPRGSLSIIELEIAAESGPGWLGSGAEPVTVSLTAETVRFDDEQLHFVIGSTVVRTVPRDEVTALTWRGSPPRGRVPGPHRNAGVVWTDEERAQLTTEVLGDLSWIEISHRHERTVSAVRREAVRMRLVDELGRRLDEPPGPATPTAPAALATLVTPTAPTEAAAPAAPSPPTATSTPRTTPTTAATPDTAPATSTPAAFTRTSSTSPAPTSSLIRPRPDSAPATPTSSTPVSASASPSPPPSRTTAGPSAAR